MSSPITLSQFRVKASEIESQIESLSGCLADAKSDLIYLMATIRMLDHSPEDAEAAKSYHRSAQALTRTDLFERCKAFMNVAREPLSTRELARAVILAEGWDSDDRELPLTEAGT